MQVTNLDKDKANHLVKTSNNLVRIPWKYKGRKF